jgi:hypothetical protein
MFRQQDERTMPYAQQQTEQLAAADVAAAGLALVEILDSLETLTSTVCCSPQQSLNLLTALALRAELRIDPCELRAEVLVVAARPRLKLS